jgi:membrane protease YdiL (CAAX protease family)
MYAWMAVFIILVQAYALWGSGKKPISAQDSRLTRQEFKQQIEKRQKALGELVRKDQALALNLGYISMFMLALLITGTYFFVNYISRKKKGKPEPIPRTLDTPKPLWGLGDVFKILILFIFYNYLFSIFAHLLKKFFQGGIIDKRIDLVASTGFLDLLAVMFILRFVIVKYHQQIDALGISIKNLWRNIGIAFYSYIGFLPLLTFIFFCVVYIAKALNYTPEPEPIYELVFEEKRRSLLIIISFLVSIIGPVAEEIFFRGFLYGALRKRLNMLWAVSLSALFFSFLHTNVIGFVPILMLGMFLAYLREKTGSLIPSITVHIIHNTALALAMFFIRALTSRI